MQDVTAPNLLNHQNPSTSVSAEVESLKKLYLERLRQLHETERLLRQALLKARCER